MINTLYNLIGERRTLNAAIESFYRRVLADDGLSHFFKNTDMELLHARQSMFVSMLLGGRVVYTGKDIAAAHAQARKMGLNASHFDAFLQHFRAALQEVGVPHDKANEVVKLLEDKRGAVLNH